MSNGGDTVEFLEAGNFTTTVVVEGNTDVLQIELGELVSTVNTSLPEEIELIEVGPGGSGGVNDYVHTQSTPAATWIVNHNLGKPKEPTVLLSSDPTIPVLTDVIHSSLNITTIVFPSPVTGVAYF